VTSPSRNRLFISCQGTLWSFLFGNSGFSPRSKGQLSWHVLWFSSVPLSKCVDKSQIKPAPLCNLRYWRQGGSCVQHCTSLSDTVTRCSGSQNSWVSVSGISAFRDRPFYYNFFTFRIGMKRQCWNVGLPTVLLLPRVSGSQSFSVHGDLCASTIYLRRP